jgi:hypothetical protein
MRQVPFVFRSATNEILYMSHLDTVNARWKYDIMWAAGIYSTYDLFFAAIDEKTRQVLAFVNVKFCCWCAHPWWKANGLRRYDVRRRLQMKLVRQVKQARQVRWSAVDNDGVFKWVLVMRLEETMAEIFDWHPAPQQDLSCGSGQHW